MQLKPSAFQLAIVWVVISLLATACSGPSVDCDDPSTPTIKETCGSNTSGGSTYYRSGYSSFSRSYSSGSSGRAGFGKTGGSRSGFG